MAVDFYTGSAGHAAIPTLSDTVNLKDVNGNEIVTRGVSFSGAGAIKVTTAAGEIVTIPSGSLAVGTIHPVAWSRIWSTGTAATNLVVYW